MFYILFLIYTIIIVAADFYLLYSISKEAAAIFVERYPGLVPVRPKPTRFIASLVAFAFITLCPVINVIFMYVIIENKNVLIEESIRRAYKQCTGKENPEKLEENGGNNE